jgi:hypothetical protein
MYDPSKTLDSYFSIGELVAVIALLLAFMQLRTPATIFRLKARGLPNKRIYMLMGFVVFAVFFAALLPFIPGKAMPIVGYPVFWEISSAMLFIGGISYLIFSIAHTPVFIKYTSKYYLEACEEIITKANEEELKALSCEITKSIDATFIAASGKVGIHSENAQNMLRLWSDKLFCRAVVTQSRPTLLKIFGSAPKHNDSTHGVDFVHELIGQSFFHNDSLLMREENTEILEQEKREESKEKRPVLHSLFGSMWFLDSAYSPLRVAIQTGRNATQAQVKKYNSALFYSYETYFNDKEKNHESYTLYDATTELGGLTFKQIYNTGQLKEDEFRRSPEYSILREISNGFEDIICLTIKNEKNIVHVDFNEDEYGKHPDRTVYSAIANGLYKYYTHLLWYTGHDAAIRSLAIDPWIKIFSVESSKKSLVQIEIGKRLIVLLKENIDTNLTERGYPAITRLLISIMGIWDETLDPNNIQSVFRDYFLKELVDKFRKLYSEDPKFAEDMLPEGVSYKKPNFLSQERHRLSRKNEYLLLLS